MSNHITIDYFSDILCVWAYAAQIRLDQIRKDFGDKVSIRCRYIPVFGDTQRKMNTNWQDRGGFAGYGEHVRKISSSFDFIDIHPDTWDKTQPASSMSCHLFLKAVEMQQHCGIVSDHPLAECQHRSLLEETAWQFRLAFFRDAIDIGHRQQQIRIAESLKLPVDAILNSLADGTAHAALSTDYELRDKHLIQGSPTFMLNDGRQKLYGNIGYRIIEANINELLESNTHELHNDQASWC